VGIPVFCRTSAGAVGVFSEKNFSEKLIVGLFSEVLGDRGSENLFSLTNFGDTGAESVTLGDKGTESLFRRVTMGCWKDALRGKKNCPGLPVGIFACDTLIC
jgi:hypothetical protein